MAWQTSPEPQFSDQQEVQGIEQVGTQDPTPAVPPLPGFSEPALTHVPSIVLQTAEAAGLGTPTREYNTGEPPRKKTLLTELDFWLIVLALCVLGGLLAILLTVRSPLNLVMIGLILAALLPFFPPILRGRKAVNSRERRAFRAWRCAGGLVYTQDARFSAVRWEHIDVVVRETATVNDTVSTVAYLVQPDGPPPFAFVLPKEPFASQLKGARESRFVPVTTGSSTNLVLVATIATATGQSQIIGKVDLSAYAGLGDLLEDQVVSQHLPGALDAYQGDSGVSFGPLVVSRQGITDGARVMLQHEIETLHISLTALQITRKPAGLVCFDCSLLDLPNVALLDALLTNVYDLRIWDEPQSVVAPCSRKRT